ncbi:hypothetical protein SLEP1_g5520 [Rubroshorea leprosula]|uniref:Uncharacterized protein n=1 Tax=Rubroshorea leprosula TaxID=152421 RepID=A0AAV5I221_9ROSI|nr:hypothetical protein SLEP1_g5520 [Rubroshorea leprosula]
MAVVARLMQIRRALSVLALDQPQNNLLGEFPSQFLPSTTTFLSSRSNFIWQMVSNSSKFNSPSKQGCRKSRS